MIRILIVDDSRSDRELLLGNLPERVFREAAFEEAASLEHVERVLSYKNFDIIILDLNLPDTQGVETFFKVKDKTFGQVPIIVLTGLDDEDLGRELTRHGADGYIVKGTTDPKQIYNVICNTVFRAHHTMRLPDKDTAELARQATASSMRLRASHQSGEMGAVQLHAADNAVLQTELLTVMMASMEKERVEREKDRVELRAIQSDIKELKAGQKEAREAVKELTKGHYEQDGRLSLVEGRSEDTRSEVQKLNANVSQKVDAVKAVMDQQADLAKSKWDNATKVKVALIATLGPTISAGIAWLVMHWLGAG